MEEETTRNKMTQHKPIFHHWEPLQVPPKVSRGSQADACCAYIISFFQL